MSYNLNPRSQFVAICRAANWNIRGCPSAAFARRSAIRGPHRTPAAAHRYVVIYLAGAKFSGGHGDRASAEANWIRSSEMTGGHLGLDLQRRSSGGPHPRSPDAAAASHTSRPRRPIFLLPLLIVLRRRRSWPNAVDCRMNASFFGSNFTCFDWLWICCTTSYVRDRSTTKSPQQIVQQNANRATSCTTISKSYSKSRDLLYNKSSSGNRNSGVRARAFRAELSYIFSVCLLWLCDGLRVTVFFAFV